MRIQGGGGKRIVGGRITTCKWNRIVGNIFYVAKGEPFFKDNENGSDCNLFVDPPGAEPFDLAKWHSETGRGRQSSQHVSTIGFERKGWTLHQNPVPKCPLVPREPPVAVDFVDTPTLGKTIPLGPLAESNNKPIIRLRPCPE
jgi:hypothetical protein